MVHEQPAGHRREARGDQDAETRSSTPPSRGRRAGHVPADPAPPAADGTRAHAGDRRAAERGRVAAHRTARVLGQPAVYTTYVRPDAVHTSYLTGLMWLDTKLLRRANYIVGTEQPGGGPEPVGLADPRRPEGPRHRRVQLRLQDGRRQRRCLPRRRGDGAARRRFGDASSSTRTDRRTSGCGDGTSTCRPTSRRCARTWCSSSTTDSSTPSSARTTPPRSARRSATTSTCGDRASA